MILRRLALGILAFSLAAFSLAALAAGAPAEAARLPRESFDKYQVLISNNVFDKSRRPRSRRDDTPAPPPREPTPAEKPPSPEEVTVLRGIVRQLEIPGAPYFAYLENLQTGEPTKVRLGDAVCQGKLSNPTLDSVDYVKNGAVTRVQIGQNLAGADAAAVSESSPVASSPATTAGAGASPSAGTGSAPSAPSGSLDSIAEQMRQKRMRSLGR